jgi:hypothetical protein
MIERMVPAAEILGNEIAKNLQQLHQDLQAVHKELETAACSYLGMLKNMQDLLKHVGKPALCKGCGAEIVFIRHIDSGRFTPYNRDGVNHFATCPQAPLFKRSKKEESHHAG